MALMIVHFAKKITAKYVLEILFGRESVNKRSCLSDCDEVGATQVFKSFIFLIFSLMF